MWNLASRLMLAIIGGMVWIALFTTLTTSIVQYLYPHVASYTSLN